MGRSTMDSVFDFNPFEVGNWMTIGLMEEEEEYRRKHQEEEEDEEEDEEWERPWIW